MSYTYEESSLIEGIISAYLVSPGASADVIEKYSAVRAHLIQRALTPTDLTKIKNALYLVLPIFNTDRSTSRAIVSTIATTNMMIKAAAQ